MTRDEAIELAEGCARARGMCIEPFEPSEWVIDAILLASSEPISESAPISQEAWAALGSKADGEGVK